MKISDELLSWIFGCECEFIGVEDYIIRFKPSHVLDCNTDILMTYCNVHSGLVDINLHTFIHLAKVKALKSKYNVTFENPWDIKVYIQEKYDREYFCTDDGLRDEDNGFNVELEIEALEWVCSEVSNG